MQVSSASFSILSNKPSGAFGVDTITIYGFDFAIYLSETSLASCCCPGGKKSASSSKIKDTFGKPRIASKWCDGNASIFTLFSSITVSFVSNVVRYLLRANSLFILSIRTIAKSILGPVTIHICEPDSESSFRQSQAINLSINSEIPKPVAFFIQRCLLLEELALEVTKNQILFVHNHREVYQHYLSEVVQ